MTFIINDNFKTYWNQFIEKYKSRSKIYQEKIKVNINLLYKRRLFLKLKIKNNQINFQ